MDRTRAALLVAGYGLATRRITALPPLRMLLLLEEDDDIALSAFGSLVGNRVRRGRLSRSLAAGPSPLCDGDGVVTPIRQICQGSFALVTLSTRTPDWSILKYTDHFKGEAMDRLLIAATFLAFLSACDPDEVGLTGEDRWVSGEDFEVISAAAGHHDFHDPIESYAIRVVETPAAYVVHFRDPKQPRDWLGNSPSMQEFAVHLRKDDLSFIEWVGVR